MRTIEYEEREVSGKSEPLILLAAPLIAYAIRKYGAGQGCRGRSHPQVEG